MFNQFSPKGRYNLNIDNFDKNPFVIPETFLLILVHLFLSANIAGLEPDFQKPLENVTVAQGRDAVFTCVVNNLGGYRVSGDASHARVCIVPRANFDKSLSGTPNDEHQEHCSFDCAMKCTISTSTSTSTTWRAPNALLAPILTV